MNKRTFGRTAATIILLLAGLTGIAQAQIAHHWHGRRPASNLVVPQSRVFRFHSRPAPARAPVRIVRVDVGVVVIEQVATTTMDISLENPSGRRQEAEVLIPVPDGAAVRGFTFQGAGKEPSAQLLPKAEARKIYNAIVAKTRDPALLEFMGYNMIRSSVFPVEARGKQKVRLIYENLLAADGNRIDYVLPRTESVSYSVPWNVAVSIRSKRPISTVYSPSHKLDTTRKAKNAVSAKVAPDATKQPGAFRLSYLLQAGGVTASLLAYPDPSIKGGYFLLLAGLPAKPPKDAGQIKREVTLVLDRSGSMHAEKIKQVREAAMQILGGLEDGEAFNIIAYNEAVDPFSTQPVLKSAKTIAAARKYLAAIKARGGTNIHDALLEALRQKPTAGMLPIVLFLTDGLPTIGQTSEVAIRNMARKVNRHKRRIFTFGVGVDVNTPLLERLALETRATSTYVLPKEDVEVKVASVFKRLSGPVVAEPKLAVVTAHGKPAAGRTMDLLPHDLPDLFVGDQLVVLGQYVGDQPLHFKLTGNYLGKQRTFKFKFDVSKATTKNAFVPRLWASRKIGVLIDAIRALGADRGGSAVRHDPTIAPKLKELVDEIVRLSKEFGILTEYTAFLAREGTDLTHSVNNLAEATLNFDRRAIGTRTKLGSVNQEYNRQAMRSQQSLNSRNAYWNDKMQRVTVSNVQQINDRAFYRRGDRWIDSRVAGKSQKRPVRVIQAGSKEFKDLVKRLSRENRAGTVSLQGDILLEVDKEAVLIKR
jgi:Ca-activated chloride channel homolog